jgi:hypothetical protein
MGGSACAILAGRRKKKPLEKMYDLAVQELSATPGARYSCIADAATRSILAERGDGDVDPAAVLGWGGSVTAGLAGADEPEVLDDLIVTARRSYHLVRWARSSARRPLLVYVCLERSRANLALARRALAVVVADRLDTAPTSGDPVPGWIPQPGPAPPAPPVPRALPGPRHGAGPAAPAAPVAPAAPAALPLPRRRPAPVQAAAPAPPAPSTGPRWAHDVGTMRRLVAGLQALG